MEELFDHEGFFLWMIFVVENLAIEKGRGLGMGQSGEEDEPVEAESEPVVAEQTTGHGA